MEGMSAVEILIVEDSTTQAEELRHILEKYGYFVVGAKNGREALDILHTGKPALVISDIVMPEMDGFELCKRIKGNASLKEIPVFLLTALSDPEDVLRGLECGADNFITKPYEENYLVTRIHHMQLNAELRRESRMQNGIEIYYKRQKYFITSERQQILDLLLSTYETAVTQNNELKAVKEKLEVMNEQLEKKVGERTAELIAEIGERKKAEEAIKRLNEGLEQRVALRTQELEGANKELEAFAYSVSHDLRAPLRSVSGFTKTVYEDYADKLDAQGKDYLVRIKNGSERMSQLIDDLLRLSHISRQKIDRIDYDLSSLASAVVNSLREAAAARSVEVVIAKGLRSVVDPNLMKIALTNMFDNALKFTSKTKNAHIEFGTAEKNGNTVYFVKDNGAGFDPSYAKKMFHPFQRLHSEKEFEGTGIGLAIVDRIIRRHEGKVWAEGEVDKGATIYFTLGQTTKNNR